MALALTYEAADNPINGTSYLIKKTVVSQDLVCPGIANNAYVEVYGSTEIGIPGVGGTSTGAFTFEVEVVGQSANTGDFSATIFRMNAAGNAVGQSSDVFLTGNQWGNGVKTFTWSSPSLGTWAAGDRFVVRVQCRWLGGTGTTGSITLRFKADGKTRIIVPWDPNVLEAPEDLTEWSNSNATITANARTAPNGATTADRVRETASPSCLTWNPTAHSLTSGDTWTTSVFYYPEGRNTVYLTLSSGSSTGVKFTCTGSGSVLASDTGYTGTIQALSGAYVGWYRLQITRTIPSTTTYLVGLETRIDGTGAVAGGNTSLGYSAFGAVLEKASSASAYPGITISSPDYTIAITALTTSSPSMPTMTVTQVAAGATRTVILTAGSSWTVPSDFGLPATVECIGGGGGGAELVPYYSEDRGGGGGGYAKKALGALTPGSTVPYAIGGAGLGYRYNGGATRAATNGGDSYFSATSFCLGRGGRHGSDQAYNATNGGGAISGSANVGDTIASGGQAGQGSVGGYAASGGGGAGGPNGAGGDGGTVTTTYGDFGGTGGGGANGGGSSTTTSTTAGTAGGTNRVGSGAGAAGVAGVSNGGAGSNGGGGGGGGRGTGSMAGGAGSQDTLWTASVGGATAGPGSGGGSGSTGAGGAAGGAGGNGGGYGGGGGAAGGGSSSGSTANHGDGTQGVIIITYTPGILPLTIGSPTLPTLTVVQFVAHPVIFLTAGSSWTVPADFNLPATVECIGGGGGGNRTASGSNQNRGGGGGGYAKKALAALTPGTAVSYAIGAAGLGNNTGAVVGPVQTASNGGDTWFNATSFCLARGGRQGADQAVGAVNGGGQVSGSANIGDVIASGGSGGTNSASTSTQATGGGGAGGPNGAGAAGGNATYASGGAAGGSGGGGANGGSAGAVVPSANGGAGGNNRSGTGGGSAGVSGGALAGAGSNGGGGGGGSYDSLDGGAGSQDSIWMSTADNSTAGPGSGGGAGGSGLGGSNGGKGGNPGGYGGGGGGAGVSGNGPTNNVNANGTQGIIVISYTAMLNAALTSLSSGSPTLPTVLIVPQNTIAITALSISSPSMPLAAATQIQVIVITTMSIGSPSMPTFVATQRHVITFTALSIGSPVFPAVAITQLQIMAVSNLSIGPPTGITGYPVVVNFTVVISLLSLSPIIPPTLVATQAHVAVLTAKSISSPTLPTLAITQVHTIGITPLAISSPALPTLAVTQVQTIAFVPLSIGSPVFPTALATQAHVIVLTAKSISSPILPTAAATQVHVAALTALSPASPLFGTLTVFQPSVIVFTPETISSPVFATFVATQVQTIVFSSLTASSPGLPTVVVAQIQVIVLSSISTGALSLPTFVGTQVHALTLTSKTIASPVLPAVAVTQVHIVQLNSHTLQSLVLPMYGTSEFILLEPTSSTPNNWTTNTGGSNLYTVVDETSPDDSDYIHSPNNPVGEIAVLTFTLPTDRVLVSPITIRYRIGKELNNATRIDQTVRVYDGADQLAEWVHTNVPFALTTIEQQMTISAPPNTLRIEIQADAP